MEVILRDDQGPSDDQVVVIHMGAGAVDVAVAAALRNFRAYQAFSASGGEFTAGFAGRIEVNMRRLLVDYSLIGHGQKFALTLLRREREGLEVGSRVEVIGDSVPPRIAEVTAVSPDEKVFEFAFAD